MIYTFVKLTDQNTIASNFYQYISAYFLPKLFSINKQIKQPNTSINILQTLTLNLIKTDIQELK